MFSEPRSRHRRRCRFGPTTFQRIVVHQINMSLSSFSLSVVFFLIEYLRRYSIIRMTPFQTSPTIVGLGRRSGLVIGRGSGSNMLRLGTPSTMIHGGGQMLLTVFLWASGKTTKRFVCKVKSQMNAHPHTSTHNTKTECTNEHERDKQINTCATGPKWLGVMTGANPYLHILLQ